MIGKTVHNYFLISKSSVDTKWNEMIEERQTNIISLHILQTKIAKLLTMHPVYLLTKYSGVKNIFRIAIRFKDTPANQHYQQRTKTADLHLCFPVPSRLFVFTDGSRNLIASRFFLVRHQILYLW